MEFNCQEMLNQVSEHVKSMANTETVIGEEFELGSYKCKPIIKIGLGFGSGSATGEENKQKCHGNGGGAGAGIGIVPVGFLITRGDEIQFIPTSQKGGLSALCEKMPEMIEKVMDMKKEKKDEQEKEPDKEKGKK